MRATIGGAVLIGLVLAGIWWYARSSSINVRNENAGMFPAREEDEGRATDSTQAPSASIGEENLVEFTCSGGKSLTAVFARDIVGLTLSDGRQMELRIYEQRGHDTLYENANRTIALSGAGAAVGLREGAIWTYTDCAPAQ